MLKRGPQVVYRSAAFPSLTEVRKRWYPNGRKIIPEGELDEVRTLGLAVWYQDDGCYSYKDENCTLSINSFADQEEKIREWFGERWGLNPRYSGGSLFFSKNETNKFLRLIAPHVVLTYKFGHLFASNLPKLKESKEKARARNKEFNKRKWCENREWRESRKAYNKKWYATNRERVLAKQKTSHYKYRRNQRLRNRYWSDPEYRNGRIEASRIQRRLGR